MWETSTTRYALYFIWVDDIKKRLKSNLFRSEVAPGTTSGVTLNLVTSSSWLLHVCFLAGL